MEEDVEEEEEESLFVFIFIFFVFVLLKGDAIDEGNDLLMLLLEGGEWGVVIFKSMVLLLLLTMKEVVETKRIKMKNITKTKVLQ